MSGRFEAAGIASRHERGRSYPVAHSGNARALIAARGNRPHAGAISGATAHRAHCTDGKRTLVTT